MNPASYTRVVIDTSAWVSRLQKADQNHNAARAWIDSYLENGGAFVAPVLLTVETAAAIGRGTKKPKLAAQAVEELIAMVEMSLYPIDDALSQEAATIAGELSLKGGDACFVALAKKLNLPLVTFDGEQLSRTKSIITAIQP